MRVLLGVVLLAWKFFLDSHGDHATCEPLVLRAWKFFSDNGGVVWRVVNSLSGISRER